MPSKLGLLFLGNPGNWLTHVERMRPTVSALMDWDSPETADELKRYSQFVLYRQYVEGGIDVSPEDFIARIPAKMFGHGLLFQGACETYCKTKDDALRVSAWFQKFGTLMKQRGEQAVAFDFSTGNPPLEVVSYLDPGDCSWIGLHEYYSTTNLYYMMQMHESFYNSLKSSARRPIIVTETGWDEGKGYEDGDGWLGHVHATNAQYMEVFHNYDAILMRQDYMVGSVAFQLGAGGQWRSFDMNPLVNDYAAYVQNAGGGKIFVMPTPTENPEYWIKVSPSSIEAGQSATVETYGEHIKAGWLYIDGAKYKDLAPVTGYKETFRPTKTTTYSLKVQLVDNSYKDKSVTLTVTSGPEPPPPDCYVDPRATWIIPEAGTVYKPKAVYFYDYVPISSDPRLKGYNEVASDHECRVDVKVIDKDGHGLPFELVIHRMKYNDVDAAWRTDVHGWTYWTNGGGNTIDPASPNDCDVVVVGDCKVRNVSLVERRHVAYSVIIQKGS